MSGRPGLDSRPSQTKYFKLVVEAPLANVQHIRVVRRKNGLIRCKNNVTGWDIVYDCACGVIFQRDINIVQVQVLIVQVVIIPSVTRSHRPEMI